MIFLLALALVNLAVAGFISYVPSLTALPLGVSVPKAYLDDAAVTTAVRSYRRWVWALGLLGAAVCLLGPLAASFSSLLVTIGSVAAYLIKRKGIITAKHAGGWYEGTETAISARIAPSVERPRFPWIWMLGSVLALIVSVLIVARSWDSIPEIVPTHWGPDMTADAWSDKSIGAVFVPSFINFGLIVLFAIICAIITKGTVHARADRSIKGQLINQAAMAAVSTGLGVMTFFMVAGFSFLQVITTLPAYASWIPATLIGVLVATIGSAIVLLAIIATAIVRLENKLQGVSFPDAGKDSPDNDEFYKWGMFYYNPADPAVLVEKRFGVGIDFNYATWQAKACVAFMVLVIIGTLALPLLLD